MRFKTILQATFWPLQPRLGPRRLPAQQLPGCATAALHFAATKSSSPCPNLCTEPWATSRPRRRGAEGNVPLHTRNFGGPPEPRLSLARPPRFRPLRWGQTPSSPWGSGQRDGLSWRKYSLFFIFFFACRCCAWHLSVDPVVLRLDHDEPHP